MGFKMKGSPAKLGTIQGTAGHKSALKMATEAKVMQDGSPAPFVGAIVGGLAKKAIGGAAKKVAGKIGKKIAGSKIGKKVAGSKIGKALGIDGSGRTGLGISGLGGDPRFGGVGQSQTLGQRIPQMDQAQQHQLRMQMMNQSHQLGSDPRIQALLNMAGPRQQPPSSIAGMNLGVGMNPLFGRAFAGKPV